jgi:hypothetical protein
MNQSNTTDPRAIRKAHQASMMLVKAAALLREAAEGSTWAQGKGDFLRYAVAIDELISCDNGEGGLGATITFLSSRSR